MEGFWPIFFLMVVLKIPVAMLLFLIWWAIRAEPAPSDGTDGGGHGFRRRRPQPRGPRGPRRDPHAPDALPLPACPPGGRFRTVRRPATRRIAARDPHPARARPSPSR